MTVRCLPLLLCLLAAFAVTAAHADDGNRSSRRGGAQPPRSELAIPGRPAPAQRSARRDALSDSVRRVQSRTGGQVLSA